MAKLSQQNQRNANTTTTTTNKNKNLTTTNANGVTKVKRTRRSVPRDSPPQRSSIYRGVTRHRWTGRYEAHLWDKNCWNESQNKKGRQVYLGAYDDEEAAAHAYDLAALKYWGPETILNFPFSTYEQEMKDMEGQSREEYIGSLRRKSSGFSRGVSKFRGVARHHHNGRWEARIGRVFGNKYLYLGTYATQEEAATAYDMAAIEYRGLNAVTNFDLSRYIKWLKPNQANTEPDMPQPQNTNPPQDLINLNVDINDVHCATTPNTNTESPTGILPFLESRETYLNTTCTTSTTTSSEYNPSMTNNKLPRTTSATSALGLLLQSSKFKEMMEMTSVTDCQSAVLDLETPRCRFPEDIQTYFESHESNGYGGGDDFMFGDLNDFVPPMFQCDFEA